MEAKDSVETAPAAAKTSTSKPKSKGWKGTKVTDPRPKSGNKSEPLSKDGPTMSLDELSARLEASFPSSQTPTNPYVSYVVDADEYVDLCTQVYRNVKTHAHHYAEHMSEAEFTLVCGYQFAKRISLVCSSLFANSDYAELSKIPELELPAPISLYLEQLGTVKMTTGETLVPDMLIGGVDNPGNFAMPYSLFSGGTVLHKDKLTLMFPFQMLRRLISHRGDPGELLYVRHDIPGPVLRTAEEAKSMYLKLFGAKDDSKRPQYQQTRFMYGDQWNSVTGDDAFLGFVSAGKHLLPIRHVKRIGLDKLEDNITSSFSRQRKAELACVAYSDALVAKYLQSQVFLSEKIEMRPFPKNTVGSEAQLVLAEPLAQLDDGSYRFSVPYPIKVGAVHVGRAFLYRKLLPKRMMVATDGDPDPDEVLSGPQMLRAHGTVKLTDVDSHHTLVQLIVSHFVKLRK